MTKTRVAVPKVISDQVLKEFNHRCARCAADRPQIHHIDENPSNNDLLNLIPLCPNCHLTDLHDPTRPIDPGKLKLFRVFRDPTILTPQFHALFIRMRFLEPITDDTKTDLLEESSKELIDFVQELQMGRFYAQKIGDLVNKPPLAFMFTGRSSEKENEVYRRLLIERDAEYRSQLQSNRQRVYELVVELLRFQPWQAVNSHPKRD